MIRLRLRALVVIAMIAGCQRVHEAPAQLVPADLEAMLGGVAGGAPADVARAVASWRLDEPTFRTTVVTTYRGLYADYVAAFAAATPALVAQLVAGGAVTARRHWGGDRRLTDAQARTRWAVPTMYPSAVAELGGVPLPIVFVPDGEHWRALAGLDDALLARVRTQQPGCDALLARAGPPGHCSDAGWMIADGALRADRDALMRGCERAATLCAQP